MHRLRIRSWLNRETGLTDKSYGLHCHSIFLQIGKVKVMIESNCLRNCLQKCWIWEAFYPGFGIARGLIKEILDVSNMAVAGSRCALVIFTILLMTAVASGAKLSNYYYYRTCPNVESIVRNKVNQIVTADRGMAPGLLRLHFHDCFVRVSKSFILVVNDDQCAQLINSPARCLKRRLIAKFCNECKWTLRQVGWLV